MYHCCGSLSGKICDIKKISNSPQRIGRGSNKLVPSGLNLKTSRLNRAQGAEQHDRPREWGWAPGPRGVFPPHTPVEEEEERDACHGQGVGLLHSLSDMMGKNK